MSKKQHERKRRLAAIATNGRYFFREINPRFYEVGNYDHKGVWRIEATCADLESADLTCHTLNRGVRNEETKTH